MYICIYIRTSEFWIFFVFSVFGSARLPDLENALSRVDIPRDFEDSRNKIREVLEDFEEKPDLASAIVIPHSDIITYCHSSQIYICIHTYIHTYIRTNILKYIYTHSSRCFGSAIGSVEEVVSSLQKELASPSRSQREITFIQETLNVCIHTYDSYDFHLCSRVIEFCWNLFWTSCIVSRQCPECLLYLWNCSSLKSVEDANSTWRPVYSW